MQIYVTRNLDMENPFKYGSVVEEPYFTDRVEELKTIKQFLNSPNHLILISPRRFGKTSLILKAIKDMNRSYVFVNIQKAVSTSDLAALIVKEALKKYPLERIKSFLKHFRIVPTISINPVTDGIDFSFVPSADGLFLLEDALSLLERLGSNNDRLIVVFDEFQEILQFDKGIDKKLRAIMQEQQKINYVFLGSQESMMTGIFEKAKSPFYHFGQLMHLKQIPFDDFKQYIAAGLRPLVREKSEDLAEKILAITAFHPYYTQQLSAVVWDLLCYNKIDRSEDPVRKALAQLICLHDLDYEHLWSSFNLNERRILKDLVIKGKLSTRDGFPASTTYSAALRLTKEGYLIKTDTYKIEDPFFKHWILEKRN